MFILSLFNFILSNPTGKLFIKNIETPLSFTLFKDVAPLTVNNFIGLSRNKVNYSGCKFHRLIKDFVVQGGDILNNNGTGSVSIYGSKFKDEEFIKKHVKGSISMANSGPNTNGSQFFICMTSLPHLDNKHVVFGQVHDFEILDLINNLPTDNWDRPVTDLVIERIEIYDNIEKEDTIKSEKVLRDI